MYYEEDEILAEELQRVLNMDGASGGTDSTNDDFEFLNPQASSPESLPNIHELFDIFNTQYFGDTLSMVEVKWSPKMRSSSGRCYYRRRGRSCCIKLSVPLLAERPSKDVIDTLLHEMIHAYLFVTGTEDVKEDHGPEFLKHMIRINNEAGTNIAVYDNFEPGPTHHRKHIWRCNGACRNKRPSFGFVKKTIDKEPGPGDYWWEEHQSKCGGSFTKISEPIGEDDQNGEQDKDETTDVQEPREAEGAVPRESSQVLPSASFEKDLSGAQNATDVQHSNDLPGCSGTQTKKYVQKSTPDEDEFDADGETLDDEKIKNEYLRVEETVTNAWTSQSTPNKMKQKQRSAEETPTMQTNTERKKLECPVCRMNFDEEVINEHIDECLMGGACMSLVNEVIPAGETERDNAQALYEESVNGKRVPCPICTTLIEANELSEHISECLYSDCENEYSSEEEEEEEEEIEDDEEDELDRDRVLCPCCFRWVQERTLDDHMSECLAFIHQASSKPN